MLKPYDQELAKVAFVFAHGGTKEDKGNRTYAVAAAILDPDGPARTFASLVSYPFLTARERYHSHISREELLQAPEAPAVYARLQAFLKDCPVVLTLPFGDHYADIIKLCGAKRIVDLRFAAEFFLPQVDSFSAKRLWEHLQQQERDRIHFTAPEVVDLSMALVEHICGKELNDADFPRAAALRYYLDKSHTLFGRTFLHISRAYHKYFGTLLHPRHGPATADWKGFLGVLRYKPPAGKKSEPFRKIDPEGLEAIYQGLSQSVKGFTFRAAQVEYARQVARTINDGAVLTIEAGTGTGKTLGYLVPVMEYLYRNKEARVAISTYTKSLQDQILQREIAFLQEASKAYRDIPVALLKGKANYLCAEKLDNAFDESWQGAPLLAWLYLVNLTYHFREADGDQVGQTISRYLNDGPFFHRVQREASARSGCDARHSRCPAQVMTAAARTARLIVTNHHKLSLLNRDPMLAELFKIFIIDEANHFEQAARAAFGEEVNSRDASETLEYLGETLGRVLSRATGDLEENIRQALAALVTLREEMAQLTELLQRVNSQRRQAAGHQELPASISAFGEGNMETHLAALREAIGRIGENLAWLQEADLCRMLKIQARTRERLKNVRDSLLEQGASLGVIADSLATRNKTVTYDLFVKHWTLAAHHVDVADIIRENFYRDTRGLVYTSATICREGDYEVFKQIVGLERPFALDMEATQFRDFRYASLPSPFVGDAAEIMVCPEAVSGDYANKSAWLRYVMRTLPGLIRKNRGRTLVLFASYQDLEAVAQRIGDDLAEARFPLLIQRSGYPTGDLCDEFRALKESVLFGVDTFWYGVDFKGDTLTQVVITRIPYPNPAEPLQMARRRTMTPADYWNRYLYDTYIKMKQGIGRLIRCETDRGKVVILDSRYLSFAARQKTAPEEGKTALRGSQE